ncbi:hypothetical protein [Phenylobacterium sp.]|uniref:hypothetical protein n=1 Tax=Phenylobacterium sp. TaxID=1871053 RepID=UPI002BB04A46|nr:hypothetical protein [Phenylobacterium sp.]HLZ73943.1 hypothetical protein [Phenylobacterium sp.]
MAGALGRAMRLVALGWAAAMLCATAAWAQTPARSVAISDLMGLGPAEVRARLADIDPAWPIQPMFEIASPDGALSFVSLDQLMIDPVAARRLAMYRTYADPVAWEPYVECRTAAQRDDRAPTPGVMVALMFRGGRLAGAFGAPPDTERPPPAMDPAVAQARQRHPPVSPFTAHAGDLPLEDGVAFLSRWTRPQLAPGVRLSAVCAPTPPPAPIQRAPHHGLDASDWQGLSLLPFAVGLPAMNRQREEARVRGTALLQSLHVGDALPAPVERFAAQHPGVRAYRGQAGYAVLSIDLGGYPTRNLSNFKDAALVGLRNDRIEWISQPSGLDSVGPRPSLLCIDTDGDAAAPRKGCHGWGQFTP